MTEARYVKVYNTDSCQDPPLATIQIHDHCVDAIDCDSEFTHDESGALKCLQTITEAGKPVVLRSALHFVSPLSSRHVGFSTATPSLKHIFLWFYFNDGQGSVISVQLKNVFVSARGQFTFFKITAAEVPSIDGLHRVNCMTFLEFVLRSRVSAAMNQTDLDATGGSDAYKNMIQVEASALAQEILIWCNAESNSVTPPHAKHVWHYLLQQLNLFSATPSPESEQNPKYSSCIFKPLLSPLEKLYLYGEPLHVNASAKTTTPSSTLTESKDASLQVGSSEASRSCSLSNAPDSELLYKKLVFSPDFLTAMDPALLTTSLLWFSLQGQVSPLHYDLTETVLTQIAGTKHVLLFPPSMSQRLSPYPLEHPHDRQSQLKDPFNISVVLRNVVAMSPPDISVAAQTFGEGEATSLRGWQCILNPGDALYIPCGWWHHVWSLPVATPLDSRKSLGQASTSPIVSLSRRWDPYKEAVRTATVLLRQHGVNILRDPETCDAPDDIYQRLSPMTEHEASLWKLAGLHQRAIPIWRIRIAQSRLLAEKRNREDAPKQ